MCNKPSNKSNIYCCGCDSLWPFMLRSASTNSPLSFHRGKPTSGSLRQWMSMHGTCTQLLPDLYQITTCDGHCWHCVESRGYPGRIKTALAAVYYQQSPALASWPTKHTGEADRGKGAKVWSWTCMMMPPASSVDSNSLQITTPISQSDIQD